MHASTAAERIARSGETNCPEFESALCIMLNEPKLNDWPGRYASLPDGAGLGRLSSVRDIVRKPAFVESRAVQIARPVLEFVL